MVFVTLRLTLPGLTYWPLLPLPPTPPHTLPWLPMSHAELVDSIVQPAADPAAPTVFFLLNHRSPVAPMTVDVLLERLRAPLLLLWGAQDPWITMKRVGGTACSAHCSCTAVLRGILDACP